MNERKINNRVSNATVLNYAEINEGDIIQQENIQNIIKKLYTESKKKYNF